MSIVGFSWFILTPFLLFLLVLHIKIVSKFSIFTDNFFIIRSFVVLRLASVLLVYDSPVGLTWENSENLLDRWESFTRAEIHNFGHKSQQIAFFDTFCRHYSILSLVWNLLQDSLIWQRTSHYLETSIATLSRSQQRRKIQSFHF